jgi:hypothetical protein
VVLPLITRLVALRLVLSRAVTQTRVMRSPGNAVLQVLPVLPPVTLLPGNSEAVTTVATNTDLAVAAALVAVVTTVLLLLGLLLSRAVVAITAMELRPDMLHLALLPVLPPVLPPVLLLGSNPHLLVAKLRTDMEATEVTPILLAWLLRPLRVCLRWLMAVLAVLLPLLPLVTSLLPLLLAINLLLPLPVISLPLPLLRLEHSSFCK